MDADTIDAVLEAAERFADEIYQSDPHAMNALVAAVEKWRNAGRPMHNKATIEALGDGRTTMAMKDFKENTNG